MKNTEKQQLAKSIHETVNYLRALILEAKKHNLEVLIKENSSCSKDGDLFSIEIFEKITY
jgi:hypothetical protein